MSNNLAINGGVPIRQGLLPSQLTIDYEEIDSVFELMKTKSLSGFRGNSSPAFYGGLKIQELEDRFKKTFNRPYWEAISVNSCTSALQLACAAIGIKPGDEVIVTPYSMCCSATAPIIFGGIPVFADIEPLYFCLDPKSVKEKITERTRAIIVVDLFGQPFAPEIIAIAKEHDLWIIEDAAQAIGSYHGNNPAGFIGDIGCFSFTQGKHLTSGEGGMLVTQQGILSRRLQLSRNHSEAVISDMDEMDSDNDLIGFNMRLTEIQAAILIEQLKKLNEFIFKRQQNAFYFAKELKEIPAITPAPVRPGCVHSYYVQAFLWDQEQAEGVHRDKFIQAVRAELKPQEGRLDLGVPISCGYIRPLYRMPLFQQAQHWSIRGYTYTGELPVVEKLWKDELFLHQLCGLDLNDQDRKDITDAFKKTWEYREELR